MKKPDKSLDISFDFMYGDCINAIVKKVLLKKGCRHVGFPSGPPP